MAADACLDQDENDDEDLRPLAACYSRYSSDNQSESSIVDQQRICAEKALDNNFRIPAEFQFVDEAVSGTLRKRDGLNRLLDAAKRKEFQVVFFHNLSRLARESVISMPILKTLVHTYGVRFISVSEGIDSNQLGWETMATVLCLHHEMFIRDLSANVFKGQAGAVLAGFSVGDYPFGYETVPSPGGEIVGRGRNAKPRMVYRLHPEYADVVRCVFRWFVDDRKNLSEILRELNRLKIPKSHRASTSGWTRPCLIRLLRNIKYIGIWPWGRKRTRRDPTTGKKRQELRCESEFSQWLRHRPELRIIDDETYAKAQELLEQNNSRVEAMRQSNGKLGGAKQGLRGPKMLSGLIRCGTCGALFYVGGAFGRNLFCPNSRSGICPCRTTLNQERAERMIVGAISQRILADEQWFQAVVDATLEAWTDPALRQRDETPQLKQQVEQLDRKIAKLLDLLENDDGDTDEIRERLKSRRREKEKLERRLKELNSAPQIPIEPPTPEWIREQLGRLEQSLHTEPRRARAALLELLDGPITVEEVPIEDRKRKMLRGTLCLPPHRTSQLITNWQSPSATQSDGNDGSVIVLEFRDRLKREMQGDEALELYEKGICMKDIAVRLGCDRSRLTKILKFAAKQRGISLEDGHARRARLKLYPTAKFEQLIEPAIKLFQQGLLINQIANELGTDRSTVTKALQAWHDRHGLEMPDGRNRRATLPIKSDPIRWKTIDVTEQAVTDIATEDLSSGDDGDPCRPNESIAS